MRRVGPRRVIPLVEALVSPQAGRTWLRFVIVVLVGAAGRTLGIVAGLPSADLLIPLLFGAAAYYLTAGIDPPFRPRRGGEVRYWRGRRIDDN